MLLNEQLTIGEENNNANEMKILETNNPNNTEANDDT